jgi:hypothetical protein
MPKKYAKATRLYGRTSRCSRHLVAAAGQHPMAEALAEYEQLLIVAMPPAGELL